MNKQVHLAIQYLATAGKSFLAPKDDDSHTNIGYVPGKRIVQTWPFDAIGTGLAFDFTDFSLKWIGSKTVSFNLDGKTHEEIVMWITKMAEASRLEKKYRYHLHYTLPYSIDANFRFGLTDQKALDKMAELRTLSQDVLRVFLQEESLESDIRIWPHHFDTGAFVELADGSGKSFGIGMAIPDSVVDHHYFYFSAYLGHDSIDTSNFKELSRGEWRNTGFMGAVLSAYKVRKEEGVQFLREAFNTYFGTTV
ncbi:hypothetical protein [Maribacter sp. 2304DJ31-5]|uniref:hypothetical protein n=1 Tax=Maribacter sp. 2304DJ31-5 TaxID=3386273 RepID=UPI0039BD3E5B